MLVSILASLTTPRFAYAQRKDNPVSQEPNGMKIRMMFSDQVLTATLYDNPSTLDFVSLLPLELTIDDYASNEKIAYLPRKLTLESSGPFSSEAPGDLCYYAPWGNLAMFYAGYRYSEGLIRLGRFDRFEPLLKRGKYSVKIERAR